MHLMLIAFAGLLSGFLLATLFGERGRGGSPGGPFALSIYERAVSGKEFDRLVLGKSREIPVLVDFHARWCSPCRSLAPVLGGLARDGAGAFLLAHVDFDGNRALARRYGVRGLPAVLLFRDGDRVDGFEGGRLAHSVRWFLQKNGVPLPGSDPEPGP